MYHVGKVLNVIAAGKEVVSADDSVQVVVEMWDKNILTFIVSPKLSKKIKKNDSVLVDYRPMSDRVPVPRHVVIKILKGKISDDVWKHYNKYFTDKQKKSVKTQPSMTPQYFG